MNLRVEFAYNFCHNMADSENVGGIGIQKNSKIVVNVEEALPDILVVTYEHKSKIFKGVLLDSTKRSLPCGVSSLNPAFTNDKISGDDRLYSVSQRYGYQEGTPKETSVAQKRQVRLPARYKNAKMTVRLRPRQVLCSKCRGICNENSENVDNGRKRKTGCGNTGDSDMQQQQQQHGKRISGSGSKRPLFSDSQSNEETQQRLCLPLRLLRATEATDDVDEDVESVTTSTGSISGSSNSSTGIRSSKVTRHTDETTCVGKSVSGKSMVLRKKRSVGSMEDLWDESVFEESGLSDLGVHNTRTIKISFGREGEGTVLKIPAKLPDELVGRSRSGSGSASPERDGRTRHSKAARRALKKAKKEARRKILLGSGGSPCYTPGRYESLVPLSLPLPHAHKHHKHKVKHKKKHREDRRQDGGSSAAHMTEMKERCLKQKLSISLRRLSASAYTASVPSTVPRSSSPMTAETTTACEVEHPQLPTSQQQISHARHSPTSSDGSGECITPPGGGSGSDEQPDVDCEGESAPNFPPPPPQPLMMRITAQTMTSGLSADGRALGIGDVVWGKIHGFPWWPGKVLNITGGGTQAQAQAHVAWYGSSTSSLMPCDQLSPFLENFKIRYNKKKRGPYKEAIKQATWEARAESPSSPPTQTRPPAVSSALASPREIDVVS